MAAANQPTPEDTSNLAQGLQPGRPAGFGMLARRISAWTTRGLLSVIILVAGVGFGRQVLRWWAAGPDESAGKPLPLAEDNSLGDPSRSSVVQFGDQPWSIRRQPLSGNSAAACTALRVACREAVTRGDPVTDHPDQAESDLLARLGRQKPVEEEPGQWQLYECAEGFPMVIGTRPWPRSAAGPVASGGEDVRAGESPPPPAGTQLAETSRRVVIWGLAVPAGRDAWALYTFQPQPTVGQRTDGLPDIPLPGGSKRLVSLRASGGARIVAFAGPEQPDAWMRFYDAWFSQPDWKAQRAWQRIGPGRQARYVAANGHGLATVDIRLGPDRGGQWTGLLIISPSPSGAREATPQEAIP
jgi:hypothetical protein